MLDKAKLRDLSKMVGKIATNLAEAIHADSSIILVQKESKWGVFMGGDSSKCTQENVAAGMRGAAQELIQMAKDIELGNIKVGDHQTYHKGPDGKFESIEEPDEPDDNNRFYQA